MKGHLAEVLERQSGSFKGLLNLKCNQWHGVCVSLGDLSCPGAMWRRENDGNNPTASLDTSVGEGASSLPPCVLRTEAPWSPVAGS